MKKWLSIALLLITTSGFCCGPKRVLVGSPIRQKPAILKEFLESLDRLEENTYTLDFCFVDDNTDPESKALLFDFAREKGEHCSVLNADLYEEAEGFYCDEVTHHWTEEVMWKVAAFKDQIIEIAKEKEYDYLFLIDSDIVLHPYTVDQLIRDNKEIVANVFWTVWVPGMRPYPQVWDQDENSHYRIEPGESLPVHVRDQRILSFVEKFEKPGLFEVGGLGACTLISRSALMEGVKFERIRNLSFVGEDRHFCVRAAALKIPLYLDTYLPAYHIYRESHLDGVEAFKKRCGTKITLSMIIKNEADRYLRDVLEAAKPYISNAVIIDDASTDNSVEVCREVLEGIPLKIVQNTVSMFSEEHYLRKQQWTETIATNPEWILVLDADEIFEKQFEVVVKDLVRNPYCDLYSFRLYDFWNETHYREDPYWNAHLRFSPFLVRYDPEMDSSWIETNQHCGRFPLHVGEIKKHSHSGMRLKHLGWAREEDRLEKYQRYQRLDPDCTYGWKAQYESILDPNPRLILWEE